MRPFISVSKLTAIIAGEATLISPYHCPDDLVKVCRSFYDMTSCLRMDDYPEDWPIVEVSKHNLARILDICLFMQPEVQAWNRRKNGREGHQFVSRYDGVRDPDDDFMDLDALKMNVIREAMRFEREERQAIESSLRKTRRKLFASIRKILGVKDKPPEEKK